MCMGDVNFFNSNFVNTKLKHLSMGKKKQDMIENQFLGAEDPDTDSSPS